MKTLWLLSISTAASLGFVAQAQGQEYLPGKIHPVETVCKVDWPNLGTQDTPGYVAIAETEHFSCGTGGKNAWKIKVLEDGDTICRAPHQLLFQGGYSSFSLIFLK